MLTNPLIQITAKEKKAADAPAPKIDKDKVRADAAYAKHLAEGGQPKGAAKAAKGKEDLSFLDAAIAPKKKK